MLELRVPVGVATTLQGLAIHLPAVSQRCQQFRDRALADPVPHCAQRRCQLRMALRNPSQQPHRVALGRRFQQLTQVFQQCRIRLRQGRPAATGPAYFARQRGGVVQVLQPAADGTSCDPCRPRRRGDAAIARRSRFRRREQPTCPLIQAARDQPRQTARESLLGRPCADSNRHVSAPESTPFALALCSPHPIRSLLGIALAPMPVPTRT